MSWGDIDPDLLDPTKLQRRACYRWGIPKRIVMLLNREQASRLLGLLIEAVSIVDTPKDTKRSDKD